MSLVILQKVCALMVTFPTPWPSVEMLINTSLGHPGPYPDLPINWIIEVNEAITRTTSTDD